jgi:rhodanese-related sulfurtransferase
MLEGRLAVLRRDFAQLGKQFMDGQNRTGAGSSTAKYAGDLSPEESWKRLSQDRSAQLVDVRTSAEWNFVGVPDLTGLGRETLFCEWQFFPSAPNPEFVQQVTEALKRSSYKRGAPLFFLCRSGARSRAAAMAMTQAGYDPCFNVAEGFEGSLDSENHRGRSAGWKAAGLPWVQT